MPNDRATSQDSDDRRLPKCQHTRLLEGIRDSHGNTTDTMKCCECGAQVSRTSQQSQGS